MKPSDDQLKAAWLELRGRRPGWPAMLADCLAAPAIRLQLELTARADMAERERIVTRTASPRHAPALPRRAPVLDFKSRAAGERDDE